MAQKKGFAWDAGLPDKEMTSIELQLEKPR